MFHTPTYMYICNIYCYNLGGSLSLKSIYTSWVGATERICCSTQVLFAGFEKLLFPLEKLLINLEKLLFHLEKLFL